MSARGSPRRRPEEFRIRTAAAEDAGAVCALDAACFPPGDPDREPAPLGQLEAGVAAGDVKILERAGVAVAYLHADTSRPERTYISGVGVHPDWQLRGLGSLLIDDCLASLGPRERASVSFVTVTSPRNLVMLRVICTRGFRGRWYLPDYFGAGKHRLGCQLSAAGRLASPEHTRLVPAGDLDGLREHLAGRQWVVEGVEGIGSAPLHIADVPAAYVLAPYVAVDFLDSESP